MKKSELIFTAVLVPLDYLMLVLAGLLAYALRTSELVANYRPVLFSLNLPFDKYFSLVLLIAFFWVVIFALSGLYKIRRGTRPWEDFVRIVIATSAGLIGIIIYIFIQREFFDSRFLILAAWVLAIVFVSWGRLTLGTVQKFLISRYKLGCHNVLVIGSGGVFQEIIQEIEHEPTSGYNPIKYLEELDFQIIKDIVEKQRVDDVILTNPDFEREAVLELVDYCEEKHINFKFVPNLFQTLTSNIEFDTLGAIPLIGLRHTALDGWGKIIKRATDIVGGLFGLIVFSPIMAVVAVLVRFDSPGPVIYKNERVGQRGIFNTYKFRSMKMEFCTGSQYDKSGEASRLEDELAAKQSMRKGPVFKIENDPRRTKLGAFLEKTSLDELPQFFNVLLGDMSLVGPRPHMPKEVAKYEKWHKKVFNIKPGLTGLAQISGRSEIDFDEEAKLDTFYIENWSLGLDFKILLKTPLAVIFRQTHRS